MASEWRAVDLADCTNNLDAQRVPMLSNLRKPGPYRYFGASGVIDNVASYIYDGDYLLVAEDGENLRTRNTPVALWVTGKFWVNNHAHVLQARSSSNGRFLYYWFQQADISGYLTGTTMPKLSQASLNRISVLLPPSPNSEPSRTSSDRLTTRST